jgi:hypothetical protein
MGVKLVASSGGSVELVPTNTASNFTVTVPAKTGTMAMDGPAFSAYLASNQTISNATDTKVSFDTETFDVGSCYDTTNKRFTPNVAGYYFVSINVPSAGPGTYTGTLAILVKLYKNGSNVEQLGNLFASSSYPQLNVSKLIYLNGSTDYIEAYVYTTAGGLTLQGGSAFSHFEGFLARSAT